MLYDAPGGGVGVAEAARVRKSTTEIAPLVFMADEGYLGYADEFSDVDFVTLPNPGVCWECQAAGCMIPAPESLKYEVVYVGLKGPVTMHAKAWKCEDCGAEAECNRGSLAQVGCTSATRSKTVTLVCGELNQFLCALEGANGPISAYHHEKALAKVSESVLGPRPVGAKQLRMSVAAGCDLALCLDLLMPRVYNHCPCCA